jgi:2-amino-4-hydroxy-6-hydroxymethyldihydropteridine diphosphokinase
MSPRKKTPPKTHVAYVALGSNLGRREHIISTALNALERTRGISVETVSSLYETHPVGGPAGQPLFLNAVARLHTSLDPERLLAVLLRVETSLGRRRDKRWDARTIDLDLLLYDEIVLADESLTVPHPRMHERRFVLEPLAEVAPDAVHPTLQMTARGLLDALGPPA